MYGVPLRHVLSRALTAKSSELCWSASRATALRHGKGTVIVQATGAQILEQLAAQRQQITHAQATVQSADQNLDKSRQILKRMSSWWSW